MGELLRKPTIKKYFMKQKGKYELMKNYTITEKDYNTMNLTRKYELALYGAEIIVNDIDGDGNYIALSYLTELYKMHALAVEMLHVTSTKDNNIIDEEQYNELIASGILNQIKDIPSINNDYVVFCEMLDREIENKLIKSVSDKPVFVIRWSTKNNI